MSFIRTLFADKLNSSDREPAFTFVVPGIVGKFAILGSPTSFWTQLLLLLLGQSLLCVVLGAIVHTFVVKNRGTLSAYLVGYGLIIPFTLWMPFVVIPFLELHNMILMISMASTPAMVLFRCNEAMYGTSPGVVEKDIVSYCIYYSSVVPFRYDLEKQSIIKAAPAEVLSRLRAYLLNMALSIPTFTILLAYDYSPFPSPRAIGGSAPTPLHLLHWGHLLNNLAIASLTSLGLEGGTLGIGLGITLVSGNATELMMKNPMTQSTSPSDFWGRRWNLAIHGLLKRGVYTPLRSSNISKPLAALATFFMSGLLHEYVLTVLALKGQVAVDLNEQYRPSYGMHFSFFLWNGMVIWMETILQDIQALSQLRATLPRPVITALVLLTVIPVSHWFTDEFVTSGYYTDYSMGIPVFVHMKVQL